MEFYIAMIKLSYLDCEGLVRGIYISCTLAKKKVKGRINYF